MSLIRRIAKRGGSLVRAANGASGTEYAFMLALIVLAAVIAIAGVGEGIEFVCEYIDTNTPTV